MVSQQTATPLLAEQSSDPPRIVAWRDRLRSSFFSLDTSSSSELFFGQVKEAVPGTRDLTSVKSTAQLTWRSYSHIRRDPQEIIMLAIQVSGNGFLDQDGRQTRLEAGDFSFVDTTRPYKLYFEGPFEQQAFCIPRKVLERQVPCLSRYTARRYDGRRGTVAVAAGFILNLASNAHLLGQDGLESYQITAAQLISAAIDTERELIDAKDLVRFGRVRSRLAKMARDPDLAFDRAASVERVSLRTLQRLFHLNGTTPTKWLLEYRLGRVAEELRASARNSVSITEIATSWGFRDLSYFSRAFREHFRVSPTEWRKQDETSDQIAIR